MLTLLLLVVFIVTLATVIARLGTFMYNKLYITGKLDSEYFGYSLVTMVVVTVVLLWLIFKPLFE